MSGARIVPDAMQASSTARCTPTYCRLRWIGNGSIFSATRRTSPDCDAAAPTPLRNIAKATRPRIAPGETGMWPGRSSCDARSASVSPYTTVVHRTRAASSSGPQASHSVARQSTWFKAGTAFCDDTSGCTKSVGVMKAISVRDMCVSEERCGSSSGRSGTEAEKVEYESVFEIVSRAKDGTCGASSDMLDSPALVRIHRMRMLVPPLLVHFRVGQISLVGAFRSADWNRK